MTDNKTEEIQSILSDVDEYLRQRLKLAGVKIDHVVLAVAPDGDGIICTNVGPLALADMADLLSEIATEAASRKPDNEPLN